MVFSIFTAGSRERRAAGFTEISATMKRTAPKGSEPLIAVLAEKPSVARDIARVLGATHRGEGLLSGNGYIVTWAIGHLVALAQPHQIRPEWKRWSMETLPIIPDRWPLIVGEETKSQFETVSKILNSKDILEVVCATDAGREGELIFRYIYELAGSKRPVKRLWISSLTDDAIKKGFTKLREGADFDPLADAARGRSRADWLIGMNFSRACTLAYGEDFSVGRVQTPTLAMVVERELAIKNFVPEDYLEIVAAFSPLPGETVTYQGTYFKGEDPSPEAKRLAADSKGNEEAKAVAARAKRGNARIESINSEVQKAPPPLFYDLTELQRHANRLHGWSAKKTLEVAQALYEQKKLISYPRTNSRHLSQDVAKTLPEIVQLIKAPYASLLAPGTGDQPLGRRFVDDSKVTDHHAIIPTAVDPAGTSLDKDEQILYDMVSRRLLCAWQPEHITSVTTVITAISTPEVPAPDRYHSTGTAVLQEGWKVLEPAGKPKAGEEKQKDQILPPGLSVFQPQAVKGVEILKKKTRPPKRFTEATLLTAMETAGKTLDDKELAEAMRDSGLGTPATRAEIIENLIKKAYIERTGKALSATAKGIRLIERVHPSLKSPALTGEWEMRLLRIQEGKADLAGFMQGIEEFVRQILGEMAAAGGKPEETKGAGHLVTEMPASRPEMPEGPLDLTRLLTTRFRLPSFRPHQEAVCEAVVAGKDVLLVMPTGAGKSLCYQLPGIARQGTTLVISPLIALMEDQVTKLQAQGFRAERIHSGRDRMASRKVCFDYLAGALDFLFIAPERLAVPGFPEMLARRKPVLVAVDEAHCISQWGHDFRPEYRMLNRWLPLLRPAPVIALTATATPRVQEDIVEQLELSRSVRSIRGFRRDNIAIEIIEMRRSSRPAAVMGLLKSATRRPAIVYAPSRKEAEALSLELQLKFPAAAYHAGMSASERDRVQAGFLSGQLDVIVATIAFGMGVDKANIRTVIHTGLPGSVEGYYQEIGRAGRDGKPSRAVLLYSWADRRLHEFFHERNYPEPVVLESVFTQLAAVPLPVDDLFQLTALEPEIFETVLERLHVHGGMVRHDGGVSKGTPAWRESYVRQREEKLVQLEQMLRFASSHECRMSYLVRHFGDEEDAGTACGQCDVCASSSCVASRFRKPSEGEAHLIERIVASLSKRNRQGSGQLFRDVSTNGESRREFERILAGLVRASAIEVREDSFVKEGQPIVFQRVTLTPAGFSINATSVLLESEQEEAPRKARKPQVKTKRKRKTNSNSLSR